MRKVLRSIKATHAEQSKNTMEKNKRATQKLLSHVHGIKRGTHFYHKHNTSFYQRRKRASQKIRNLSSGKINLVDNVFHGEHRLHLVHGDQPECGHVYKISLYQLAYGGVERACPFCNSSYDLRRYGSINAIQEFVTTKSDNKISFLPDNQISGPDDLYRFACNIHGFIFESSFRSFIDKIEDNTFCYICSPD